MSAPIIFDSAEEMAARQGSFKNLPEEEYVLEVAEIEVLPDRTSQFNKTPHDEWKVRFNVVSFSDGTPAYFEDGSEPEPDRPIRLTAFIDPSKKGMVPRPSKARKFLTGAIGVPTEARIELDSVDDLIGKRLIGRVVHKTDSQKIVRDRLEDFRAISRRPARKVTPKADEEVTADAESLLAKAKEVFADEAKFD